MFISDELVKGAIQEAIERWTEGNGDKDRSNSFREFLRARLTEDTLGEFELIFASFVSRTTGFQVGRTLGRGCRMEIIKLCHQTFSPLLHEGGNIPQNWEIVDGLATEIQSRKWSARECRPISFASKFATMVSPDFYAPYDSYSSSGLSAYCGAQNGRITFKRGNYNEYMTTFADFVEKFSYKYQIPERIGNQVNENDVRATIMRVSDKALMKIGGYQRF